MKNRISPDWVFGLMVGWLTGMACAMTLVHPEIITPESPLKKYVVIGGLLGAMATMVIRNRYFDSSAPK